MANSCNHAACCRSARGPPGDHYKWDGQAPNERGRYALSPGSRWRKQTNPLPPWADEPRVKFWPARPHRTAHTRLWSRAPSSFGRYYLELCLVQENVRWLDHQAAFIELEVDH